MNKKQLEKMHSGKGFIAALDQSGGSTPKALLLYGITQDAYQNEEEMFDLVHAMRTRIITSPVFDGGRILGAILFEMTMNRQIEGMPTADYLWNKKGIVPFLKIDKGLADIDDGVQLMKPIPDLDATLDIAVSKNIFGTKMRSVIKAANCEGIKKIVDQQFELAHKIVSHGLVPIIEPEVDIHIYDKPEAEAILLGEIKKHMDEFTNEDHIMFKLSLPSIPNYFQELEWYPCVVRVVALSGGYSREEADEILAKNNGVIASFSRALSEGLYAQQTDEQFDRTLNDSIQSIYDASMS